MAVGSDVPTAVFSRPLSLVPDTILPGGGSTDKGKAYLDIAPDAEGMADMILAGFVYMEVVRQKKEGAAHA